MKLRIGNNEDSVDISNNFINIFKRVLIAPWIIYLLGLLVGLFRVFIEISFADFILFYGSYLSACGTVLLGVLAFYQNQKLHDSNYKIQKDLHYNSEKTQEKFLKLNKESHKLAQRLAELEFSKDAPKVIFDRVNFVKLCNKEEIGIRNHYISNVSKIILERNEGKGNHLVGNIVLNLKLDGEKTPNKVKINARSDKFSIVKNSFQLTDWGTASTEHIVMIIYVDNDENTEWWKVFKDGDFVKEKLYIQMIIEDLNGYNREYYSIIDVSATEPKSIHGSINFTNLPREITVKPSISNMFE